MYQDGGLAAPGGGLRTAIRCALGIGANRKDN
jgi:hypothetical protein